MDSKGHQIRESASDLKQDIQLKQKKYDGLRTSSQSPQDQKEKHQLSLTENSLAEISKKIRQETDSEWLKQEKIIMRKYLNGGLVLLLLSFIVLGIEYWYFWESALFEEKKSRFKQIILVYKLLVSSQSIMLVMTIWNRTRVEQNMGILKCMRYKKCPFRSTYMRYVRFALSAGCFMINNTMLALIIVLDGRFLLFTCLIYTIMSTLMGACFFKELLFYDKLMHNIDEKIIERGDPVINQVFKRSYPSLSQIMSGGDSSLNQNAN